MRAAIHQPHYFPWVGYFDKMAKADTFILMDEVQLEDRSYMLRNRFLREDGMPTYLSIAAAKKGYREKKYNEIEISQEACWQKTNINAIKSYYRKALAFQEVMPIIELFLSQKYATVCQWTCASIELVRNFLDIQTPLVYQSSLDYDRSMKRSDLIYVLCKAIGADTYFSGRGASVEYLDREKFAENGVQIVFQDFTHPIYPQINTKEFIPGISILDMLFNCGIEESRRIFWENVKRTNEFGEL